MISTQSLIALFLAYLLGSIPTAVWIGKIFYGIDVREYGSGNAGTTNTFRILGKKAGIPVMLIDVFKGWLACYLAHWFSNYPPESIQFANFQLSLGIIAIVGHIFPVFAGFRGGKGIATLFGMVLAIHLQAALCCCVIFLVILIFSHYVSLGSMIASFSYPVLMIFAFHVGNKSVILFGVCVAVLVLVTHQKNIERLLKGKESKSYLFKKKVQN
ncbi:acyl-phosphate glycerol 3-phosphate acyltransferase [Solitalea longa]|uniref:Glycerol-3-phosphate acyltransferase n=1 Tax=Solitalea longa TaxID=2079460 RepID=A0A2S4ZY70_9SPHI|nr:glycerol-3-phosphate 1-O-acyltransferase PlsY [Solitalea longa]POY35265.1 acyl-phosphate glycerol 3-phosphate acyltransferase [Solitalea longa]